MPSTIKVKSWKLTGGAYTSPHMTMPVFKDCKSRIIREKLVADFDDKNGIIKIFINKDAAKHNEAKLEKLGWI